METTTLTQKDHWVQHLSANGIVSLVTVAPDAVAAANNALKSLQFPTTRVEDWKYTRVARIANETWKIDQQASAEIAEYMYTRENCDVVVFVNGFFKPELSSITSQTGVTIVPFNQVEGTHRMMVQSLLENSNYTKDIFQSMNVAFNTDGLFIHVEKNTIVERDIHVLHVSASAQTMSTPIIAIHVERGAQMHHSLQFVGNTKSFTNAMYLGYIASGAHCTLDKIQMEGEESFLMNNEHVEQAENSVFTINTLTVDGNWVRNNLNIRLNGLNCETHLSGFYMPRGNQHIDNHTLVDHLLPHGQSNELYKGVVYDKAKAVFNGKVYVRPDAQKTNAYQNNANIMMSDDASVNTKPELEIYADDVKCSHGTTTGQFDEAALFYLRARGLGEESARKMLVTAFVADVLDKVNNDAVREYVIAQLNKRGLMTL